MEYEIGDYADSMCASIDDLPCTLSFVIFDPKKLLAVSIGDSPHYMKIKRNFLHMDENSGLMSGNISYSVFDFNMNYIAISMVFTDDIQAILYY